MLASSSMQFLISSKNDVSGGQQIENLYGQVHRGPIHCTEQRILEQVMFVLMPKKLAITGFARILGDVFMGQFHIVFDYGNMQVGFPETAYCLKCQTSCFLFERIRNKFSYTRFWW